ncbi:flagellar hook-associated protein FlgL [Clostridium sp.]|uniref:flagellar hook-associated protein FlgL n=1 Tax=Clostridium sp. TaxID=1506 RepID=UPI002FDEFB78
MRITNKYLTNSFLSDMKRNLNNLNKIQEQLSSTKNFSKPSDDPLNVQKSMQLQTSIDANSQYGTNIKTALTWMESTDTTLGQIGTVLSNIRTNLVEAGNAAYGQDDRDKINDEVNQQVSQLAQLFNTNLGGEYIFGGTQGLSKPVTTESYSITRKVTDDNGNTSTDTYEGCISLKYADKDGKIIEAFPQVISDDFNAGNWSGKSITFNVKGSADTTGTDYSLTVNSSDKTVDDVIKNLNTQIQNNPNLKDKINVVKINDGNIKFLAVDESDTIKLTTDIADMASTSGKQISSVTMDNIASDKNIEVSQGVVLSYNATAVDVMQYGDGQDDDIRALMDRIVHHLAGQVESTTDADGNTVDENTTGAILGSDGNYYIWKDDATAAKEKLTNEDLDDIDAASKQILKVRSEIGAKESRMEDLSTQNSSTKISLTETLSKIEDIDVTEKTVEYSTMITVYIACLQTSAKIMQSTLMDYLN